MACAKGDALSDLRNAMFDVGFYPSFSSEKVEYQLPEGTYLTNSDDIDLKQAIAKVRKAVSKSHFTIGTRKAKGKSGYNTESELRQAVALYPDEKQKLSRGLAGYGLDIETAKRWAAETELAFLSYRDLGVIAINELEKIEGSQGEGEIFAKLLSG